MGSPWTWPLQVAAGLLLANLIEWVAHRFALHGLGKRPDSFFAFHWGEHHRACRRQAFFDDVYRQPLWQWNAHSKEALCLFVLMLVVAPLFALWPVLAGTLWYAALNYYRRHRRSHLDPAWGRRHLPWHYEHHMGRNQDANWCVSRPWFDRILGTATPYAAANATTKVTMNDRTDDDAGAEPLTAD